MQPTWFEVQSWNGPKSLATGYLLIDCSATELNIALGQSDICTLFIHCVAVDDGSTTENI